MKSALKTNFLTAGLGGKPYRDVSYEYYINERKKNNDPKATGHLFWQL